MLHEISARASPVRRRFRGACRTTCRRCSFRLARRFSGRTGSPLRALHRKISADAVLEVSHGPEPYFRPNGTVVNVAVMLEEEVSQRLQGGEALDVVKVSGNGRGRRRDVEKREAMRPVGLCADRTRWRSDSGDLFKERHGEDLDVDDGGCAGIPRVPWIVVLLYVLLNKATRCNSHLAKETGRFIHVESPVPPFTCSASKHKDHTNYGVLPSKELENVGALVKYPFGIGLT